MDTELGQYHDRLMSCRAIIDLGALASNLAVMQGHAPGAGIVAMVKANAYGHGLVKVSRFLQSRGVKLFGVATLEEGIILRREGIKGTILLMGGASFLGAPELVVESKLTPLISSVEEIDILAAYARVARLKDPIEVHLDLDTGISRAGLVIEDDPSLTLTPVVDRLKKNHAELKLTGVASHFANADQSDCAYSLMQMERFFKALDFLDDAGCRASVIHFAKSAAILNRLASGGEGVKKATRSRQLWIRPGISLYGITPFEHESRVKDLKPILTLKAVIAVRKRVSQGASVGYGNTWIAPVDTELAILRVGYGDGYNWRLSNQGQVLIGGQRAPIVGRVSMDLVAVDVTRVVERRGIESCGVGTLATLIGEDGDEEITAFELAQLCQTIPYEIVTAISQRVPRIYING